MPETLHIDLLRHGETAAGRRFCGSTDTPLTTSGWEQMWSAVEAHAARWERIVTSPLTRCAAFAHALAQHLQLPYTLDTRLGEMHFGAWEGKTAAEIMATDAETLTRFWDNPARHTPPGAEALLDFRTRVLQAWHDILSHPGGNSLLITHGGVMRVLLCHVLQQPIEKLLDFEVAHAALWRIRVEYGHGHIHCALTERVA